MLINHGKDGRSAVTSLLVSALIALVVLLVASSKLEGPALAGVLAAALTMATALARRR